MLCFRLEAEISGGLIENIALDNIWIVLDFLFTIYHDKTTTTTQRLQQ